MNEPLELIERDGVIGFWYDDDTPEELVRDAEARALAMLAKINTEKGRL